MKISVITVARNSEKTIEETLSSVAHQSYLDVEHILVDGGSSDATIEIIKKYRRSNLNFLSEADEGIYDAMNKGFRLAGGEVIGFLNSDDFYFDSFVLEKVAFAFQDESIEACFADLIYITRDKSSVSRYWKSNPFKKGDFAKGWCPPHPTFYIRKSALQRLGFFDQSYKLAADVEFMMRYLEVGNVKSVYIPSTLVCMRLGGATNQSFHNIATQNNEVFKALKKNHIIFNPISFWLNKLLARFWQYFTAKFFKVEFVTVKCRK